MMWNDKQQRLLTSVLDEIIPASRDGKMPGAGALGLVKFLEREISGNSENLPLFQGGLEKLEKLCEDKRADFCDLSALQRVAILKQMEVEDMTFFQMLVRCTYMGYYSRPDIRARMQLSAKPVHPDGYDVAPETPEQMSELTQPVVERGRCFRSC